MTLSAPITRSTIRWRDGFGALAAFAARRGALIVDVRVTLAVGTVHRWAAVLSPVEPIAAVRSHDVVLYGDPVETVGGCDRIVGFAAAYRRSVVGRAWRPYAICIPQTIDELLTFADYYYMPGAPCSVEHSARAVAARERRAILRASPR